MGALISELKCIQRLILIYRNDRWRDPSVWDGLSVVYEWPYTQRTVGSCILPFSVSTESNVDTMLDFVFSLNSNFLRSPRIPTQRAVLCQGAVASRRCSQLWLTSKHLCLSPEAQCNRACTLPKVCEAEIVDLLNWFKVINRATLLVLLW